MNLVNSQELNIIVQKLTILGKDRFVEISEERYRRQIDYVADYVLEHGIRLVLLAGPSGSGKTTTAHNLRKVIASRGHTVYSLSMDNWYRTVGSYDPPVDEAGNPDTESPECLNIRRFNSNLVRLFSGEQVTLPIFDFVGRISVDDGPEIKLRPDDIVIVEGLHALNPIFKVPADVNSLRLYVSPADVIVDENTVLDNQYIRLCRRIYRDVAGRAMSPEATLAKNESVNRGERLYLEPFLHNAGVLQLDTLIDYELFIHRRMLPDMKPLSVIPLSKLTPDDIPDGSILREFYVKKQV